MAVTKTTQEKLFVPFSALTIAVFVSQKVLQEERHLSLVRPLLVLNRYQTKKLCQLWEMPAYPDQTNEELVFTRNRIRKQLLPILRSFFNPQIDAVLSHLSEALLLEWLHGEFLLVKVSQNTGGWNPLQPVFNILQFWQTKAVVQRYSASVDRPHVRNVLRFDMAVESNSTLALSHFPRHRSTRLGCLDQSLFFEPLRVSCLPNTINQKVLNQSPCSLGEWSANGHIQVRRSLVVSLQKRCGRWWPSNHKPLPTKMVNWLSKTQFGQSSSLDLEKDRTLREKTSLSACWQGQENTSKNCSSLRHKDILFCQPVESALHNCSMRYHYFYFPKFGCFVTLGTTLSF